MNVGGAVPAAILPTKTNRRAERASHIFIRHDPTPGRERPRISPGLCSHRDFTRRAKGLSDLVGTVQHDTPRTTQPLDDLCCHTAGKQVATV